MQKSKAVIIDVALSLYVYFHMSMCCSDNSVNCVSLMVLIMKQSFDVMEVRYRSKVTSHSRAIFLRVYGSSRSSKECSE